MTGPVFVDTNVLIYALDRADPKKHLAAREWRAELWRRRQGRISFQVLEEFYAQVTRQWPKARQQARSEVRDLLAWRPVAIDGALVEHAWKIQDRFPMSFWDALIVAAAKAAACPSLLSEDFQDGQDLDGLRVLSPFRHPPASFFSP
jgi:predicted nucleic acid-binding protein